MIFWKQDPSIKIGYYIPPRLSWSVYSREQDDSASWRKNANGIPYTMLESTRQFQVVFKLPSQNALIKFFGPSGGYDQFSNKVVLDTLIESFSESGER